MRRAATAFGAKVASPIVESLDINAILAEVDVNEVIEQIDLDQLFERVDLDRLIDRVDLNRALDRVDANRLLARVDIDRHLARVDLNAVIAQTNLQEIVRNSTSGVCGGLLNLFRTRLAWIDQQVQRFFQCCFWCSCLVRPPVYYLPPRPGRHPEDSRDEWDYAGGLDQRAFSQAIQFRTCGALNRIIGRVLDQIFVWFSYAIVYAIIGYLYDVFKPEGGTRFQFRSAADTNSTAAMGGSWEEFVEYNLPWYWDFLIYYLYTTLYWVFQVGCVGKTLGMWLVGTLLVSRNGSHVPFLKVCSQVLLVPLNWMFFGWVAGFLRRDGKMWSDLLGCVAIVYAYDTDLVLDARNAEMARSLTEFMEGVDSNKRERGDGDVEFGNVEGRTGK